MAILDEIQASIRQLADGAGSSVAGIGQRWGAGSGIVLGEGRVLTNAHNLRGDQVAVTFARGRTPAGSGAGRRLDRAPPVTHAPTRRAPPPAAAPGPPPRTGPPACPRA